MKKMNIKAEKIALIADPHIGLSKNSEEFFQITEDWFDYFIKEIETRKIYSVFVLGDWFHYRDEISVKAIDFASKILKKFPKSVHIYMLTGNHDCYLKDTSEIHSLKPFAEWENITIFDEVEEIELVDGKTLTVYPWGTEGVKKKRSDYVFGHFEITNFKWNSFSICENGTDSKDILNMGVNVFSGHFHKRQEKSYKNGTIRYLGSPFQHNFNDVGNENGFHILNFKTGDLEFVQNDGFPEFKNILYSKSKKLKKDEYSNDFVRLIIDEEDVKESQIEKTSTKVWSQNPRNVVIDDKNVQKIVDYGNLDVNIEEIDTLATMMEFVDSLDEIKQKDKIKTKLKEIYEKSKEH